MSSSQRRPPKLKTIERAVSVIVDDYSPRQSGSFSLSPRPSAIFADQQHMNIQRSTESVSKMASSSDRSINKKQKSLYRGETIDMMDLPSTSSTSLKNNQRRAEYNLDIADCNPISRHYSIRHPKRNSNVSQATLISKQQQQDSLTIPAFHSNHPSPQKMYSPYKDVHTFSSTSPIRVEANSSFGGDDHMAGTSSNVVTSPYSLYDKPRPKLPPKQKSISYFDELEDLNKKYSSDLHKLSVRASAESASRQASSNSLEKIISSNSPRPQATRSAEKLLRRHQTLTSMNQHLIAPMSLANMERSERAERPLRQPYSFKSVGETIKKSQSFRYKPPREAANENRELFKSRKSKSFVNSVDDTDYICTLPAEPSPSNYPINFSKVKHHRPAVSPMSDRKIFLDELRGLSGDGADLLPENSAAAVKIDFGALDFNTIYKSYRAQQKTLSGNERSDKRKSFDSPSSGRNNGPGQFKYSGKRKKVAITIFVITFCVVLFAATAVIVTLTNSNGTQVHNQTRQIITNTRDSRPIHFGGGFSGIN